MAISTNSYYYYYIYIYIYIFFLVINTNSYYRRTRPLGATQLDPTPRNDV